MLGSYHSSFSQRGKEHQLEVRLSTQLATTVVLGAYATEAAPLIQHLPISIFTNPNWQQGMGNSISFGVSTLLQEYPNTKGILISVVDQPLIDTAYLGRLIHSFQHNQKQILVSKALDWQGVPAIFDQCYFDELMALDGEKGAKKVSQKYAGYVKSIEGGSLLVDMDTPEVYEKLRLEFGYTHHG